MNKKKLVINCAVCDTRTVTEEVLNLYESIKINASAILVSKESKELLSRYPVTMSAADVMELSEDAEVIIQNGSYEISEGTIMSKPSILLVNGSLTIGKNSEKALKSFISIKVNGSVSYPSDLQNQLPPISVNGSTNTYPSDAICLKDRIVLDKAFLYKAKEARYYVEDKVVIADEALDVASLAAKGSSFITKTAIIPETLLENAVQLFEDDTDIIEIPAGYRYVQGGKLDNLTVNQNGSKLFVDGDLMITSESEKALSKLTDIKVNGAIYIFDKLMDMLLTIHANYNELKQIRGNIIADKGMLSISKHTLEGMNDGVTIIDCGMVQIHEDVTPSEIENKLQFIGCGFISCYPEQKGVVNMVSEDVGLIKDKAIAKSDNPDEASGDPDESSLYPKDTQVINSASYKM